MQLHLDLMGRRPPQSCDLLQRNVVVAQEQAEYGVPANAVRNRTGNTLRTECVQADISYFASICHRFR
jgi:hypothetical protein